MATRIKIKYDFAISRRALRLLSHPLSIAAIALMLANDLLLRRLWPSWWTGKLSDAAWLVIAPLLGAALLGALIPMPRGERSREAWIFGAAFAAAGLGFAAIKFLPAINTLTTRIFTVLLGAPPALALDPSDLLTLPALLIPITLWQRSLEEHDALRVRTAQTARDIRAYLVLPIAMIALLADAPAPDTGFTCFQVADGKVYASAGYNAYVSTDGGRTWQDYQPGANIDCSQRTAALEGWTEVPGPTPDRLYRYRAGEEIQVSTDGGATWQTGIRLSAVSEAQRYYVLKSRDGSPIYSPGPLDAIADPVSGNMLFAMGQEGVIVHEAGGKWINGSAGSYQNLENFPDASAFSVLLGGNVYMALLLALLVFATGALRRTFHPVRLIVLIIAWLGWLIVDLIFPPATSLSYAVTITAIGLLLVGLFIVPLVIEQIVRLTRRAPRKIIPLAGIALGAGLVFLLPFAMWVYSILPRFELANIAGLVAAGAFAAAAFLMVGKKPVVD